MIGQQQRPENSQDGQSFRDVARFQPDIAEYGRAQSEKDEADAKADPVHAEERSRERLELRGINHSEVLGAAQQSQRYEAGKGSDCEDGLFNEPEERPEQGDILVDGLEDDVNAPEQYDDRRVDHQIAGKAESKQTFGRGKVRRGLHRVAGNDQAIADEGFAKNRRKPSG